MLNSIVVGLLCSLCIGGIAYRKRSLSFSGVWAACLVGTLIFSFGSIYWFGLLLAFFISSSILSMYRKRHKRPIEDRFAKTGRRDALQVFANGGVGALIAVAHHYNASMVWLYLYLGVMATVNADTWGTEIGILSRAETRHILTWKRVEKGTSGGISAIGTLGTALGALFIGGGAFFLLWLEGHFSMWVVGIGLVAGVSGAMADSVLGATIQKMYYCTGCHKPTEKNMHCGLPTVQQGGWYWCNNDMVNMMSSIIGGLVATALYTIVG